MPLFRKYRGLLRREAQVARSQLGQLATGAQAGQRQRRVDPGRDDQVHLGRQVLQKIRQRIVDGLGLDQVVVIQHQCQRIG